jgi:hypothetical protein
MNQICRDKLDDWIKRRLNVFCETNQTFDPAQEMLLLTLSIISEAALEYENDSRRSRNVCSRRARLASKEYVLKQGNNPIRATWLGYLFCLYGNSRGETSHQEHASHGSQNLNVVSNATHLQTHLWKELSLSALSPIQTTRTIKSAWQIC